MIDFAYDTDWTGLRNWTGFLAGLPSLPFSANHPLEMALPLLAEPSFPISRVSICLDGYIDVARVYTHRCNVYA